MNEQLACEGDRKKEIIFPNGNRALAVVPTPWMNAEDITCALGLDQPTSLILLFGGATKLDEALIPRLGQLFSRGIARAATQADALIIDGGTQVGVMAMMGQGVAECGRRSSLLGVVPSGKVTYNGGPAEGSIEQGAPLDSNHSHFVFVESNEWGGEVGTMFEIAQALGKGIPVLTVLVNGGLIARDEVLRSVRQGWSILVVEGSGRLADELAILWQKQPAFIDDPVMAEIIADGDIRLFPRNGSVAELGHQITHYLTGGPTLRLAWDRFALYDANAVRQQSNFNRLQRSILGLGVLGTFLALTQAQLGLQGDPAWSSRWLHYAIVLVPISVAVLIAAANRFKGGNKWVVLRGAAEGIKREIFRYRTRTEGYHDQPMVDSSSDAKLAKSVGAISCQLMQTEVNLSALLPYDGPIPPKMFGAASGDDGLSYLTPARYFGIRLSDQLSYYRGKTNKLEKKLQRLQWLIYIFGGTGTLLAALEFELWVALTTTVVGAFTTHLEYQQIENNLTKYNQASTDLSNVQAWWAALSVEEQTNPSNIDKLVGYTEKILESEHVGWVQQMQDAQAELHAQRSGEPSDQ